MKHVDFFWMNLYGAPSGESLFDVGGALVNKMNENPTIATIWKGRVLVGVEFDDKYNENPKA